MTNVEIILIVVFFIIVVILLISYIIYVVKHNKPISLLNLIIPVPKPPPPPPPPPPPSTLPDWDTCTSNSDCTSNTCVPMAGTTNFCMTVVASSSECSNNTAAIVLADPNNQHGGEYPIVCCPNPGSSTFYFNLALFPPSGTYCNLIPGSGACFRDEMCNSGACLGDADGTEVGICR